MISNTGFCFIQEMIRQLDFHFSDVRLNHHLDNVVHLKQDGTSIGALLALGLRVMGQTS